MIKLMLRLGMLAAAVWGLSHFAPKVPDMPNIPLANTTSISDPEVRRLTSSLATLSSAATLDASGFCSRKPDACEAGKEIIGQGAELVSAAAMSVQGWARQEEAAASPPATVSAPLPMPRP